MRLNRPLQRGRFVTGLCKQLTQEDVRMEAVDRVIHKPLRMKRDQAHLGKEPKSSERFKCGVNCPRSITQRCCKSVRSHSSKLSRIFIAAGTCACKRRLTFGMPYILSYHHCSHHAALYSLILACNQTAGFHTSLPFDISVYKCGGGFIIPFYNAFSTNIDGVVCAAMPE